MDGPELLGPEQEQEGQIEAINLEALHWDDDEGSFEEPVPVQQLLEQLVKGCTCLQPAYHHSLAQAPGLTLC